MQTHVMQQTSARLDVKQASCEESPALLDEQMGMSLVPDAPLPHSNCSCVRSAAW